jgi:hypothetical protein
MSRDIRPEFDRLSELLIDRATVGLNEREAAELRRLLESAGTRDDLSFDLTAAAIDLAVGREQATPLPEALKQRVMADAMASFAIEPRGHGVVSRPPPQSTGLRTRDLIGLLAIAASLLVALWAWLTRPTPESLAPGELRARLLAQAPPDLVRASWSPTAHPHGAAATGEVVWSDSRQTGFMTFRGLPANQPTREQYQLWIFDKERDERYPVDGGVFDIASAEAETVVPIDPKIRIHEATLFAVTIERPGGVVVSDRQQLPLTASVTR